MPDIKDSVGEGGLNQGHDVALVQAMLRVVKNAKGLPYLGGNYDGSYGGNTKAAILAFQKDHKTANAGAAPPPVKLPGAGAPAGKIGGLGGTLSGAIGAAVGAAAGMLATALLDKAGHVKAKGPTIEKLNAMLPADYKDIRIIEGTKTLYWPGAAADADKHAKAIEGDADLEAGFRATVAKLVRTMFDRHKIVLSLTNTGGRRTFQKQYELRTQPKPPTGAGPGESNHNFGQAVDIGYKDFKWMKGDGRAEKDSWWLNDLAAVSGSKAQQMWEARNRIAVDELGLHPSALKGDLIHLQQFSDAKVSMRRSLADLLTRVGTMKWQDGAGGYKCDLGGGKAFFPVGSAVDIWKGDATVSKAEIAGAKGVPVGQIKEADVKAMRQKLRGDFDLAQTNWEKWEAK
jgi:peptidoglycan hydrolase-like protein with peptidoglycan-binding domain